jgi:putative membrane protein
MLDDVARSPGLAPAESTESSTGSSHRALYAATAVVGAALLYTAIDPADRLTWSLESLPVIGVLAALWLARNRFPLTPVLHAAIAASLLMLCVGAYYTFERVPLGEWLQATFGLDRNPYDRIGHVLQGLVPALAARELFVRTTALAGSAWLGPLAGVLSFAVSAAYELVEWGVARVHGPRAAEFLGMQGDPWDAHWDMLCALGGATAALLLLARAHDRALARLAAPKGG